MPLLSRKAITLILFSEISFVVIALGLGYMIGVSNYNRLSEEITDLKEKYNMTIEEVKNIKELGSTSALLTQLSNNQQNIASSLRALNQTLKTRLQALDQSIKELSAFDHNLASKLNEVYKETINSKKYIYESLTDVDNRLAYLEVRISSYEEAVSRNLNLSVEEIESVKTSVLRSIGDLTVEVRDVTNRLATLETGMKNLQSLEIKFNKISSKINNLTNYLDTISILVKNMQTSIDDISTSISLLTDELIELKDTIRNATVVIPR